MWEAERGRIEAIGRCSSPPRQQRLRQRSALSAEKPEIKKSSLVCSQLSISTALLGVFLEVSIVRMLRLKLYAPLWARSKPRKRLCVLSMTAACIFIARLSLHQWLLYPTWIICFSPYLFPVPSTSSPSVLLINHSSTFSVWCYFAATLKFLFLSLGGGIWHESLLTSFPAAVTVWQLNKYTGMNFNMMHYWLISITYY